LGYIIREYEKNILSLFKGKKSTVKIVTLFILQLLFLIVFSKISNSNIVGTLFKNSIFLLCNIAGTLFYFLVLSLISYKYKSLNSNRTLNFLDKESFAIYLFHSPLIYIVLKYIANKNVSPFLVVPSMFIIILFGSLGISYLIKKTQILKFVIGSSLWWIPG